MDSQAAHILVALLHGRRSAALGTLRDGYPFVSFVLFSAAPDFSAFYLHISRLAHHTQDLLKDPRASLMVAQSEGEMRDPQQLARVSILGEVHLLSTGDAAYAEVRAGYLGKYPEAAINFSLGDFGLYALKPDKARYVAGFGKIFNLSRQTLRKASTGQA